MRPRKASSTMAIIAGELHARSTTSIDGRRPHNSGPGELVFDVLSALLAGKRRHADQPLPQSASRLPSGPSERHLPVLHRRHVGCDTRGEEKRTLGSRYSRPRMFQLQ